MESTATEKAATDFATDVKVAEAPESGIATGQASIALPKAGDKIARLASWAVTDPNQLNPAFFSFKDVSCVLKSEGKPKVLLDMVSGYCKVNCYFPARFARLSLTGLFVIPCLPIHTAR
jgi:hypothetical protein